MNAQFNADRFWRSVAITPSCWEWQAAKSHNGYGLFRVGASMRRVHRLSYELHLGAPGTLCVCHRCDLRTCVNPAHLFLGSQTENLADMTAKGRRVIGEQVGTSKLLSAEVHEIREALSAGISKDSLAARFRVSTKTILNIERRTWWRHI